MALDAALLKDLCCPETHQGLRMAPPQLLAAVNDRIGHGTARNRSGQLLKEPCEAGLIREDGALLYPIRRGLPILLIAEAIELT